jgi:hypothetical protein
MFDTTRIHRLTWDGSSVAFVLNFVSLANLLPARLLKINVARTPNVFAEKTIATSQLPQ